jgi:hypothetical protein
MKPPIIALEGNSILIFKSVGEAEGYLEPVDVENGEYRVFDTQGHLLRLEIEYVEEERKCLWFSTKGWREKVSITDYHPPIDMTSELRESLITYLSKRDDVSTTWLERASLEELVSKAYPTHW